MRLILGGVGRGKWGGVGVGAYLSLSGSKEGGEGGGRRLFEVGHLFKY